jgi:DNA-binding MarR family transcriptional regulator
VGRARGLAVLHAIELLGRRGGHVLVAQLEAHGYVIRVSDPNDRRAKLVLPTARGQELFTVVQKLVPKMEQRIRSMVGKKRARELCTDLKKLRRLESL